MEVSKLGVWKSLETWLSLTSGRERIALQHCGGGNWGVEGRRLSFLPSLSLWPLASGHLWLRSLPTSTATPPFCWCWGRTPRGVFWWPLTFSVFRVESLEARARFPCHDWNFYCTDSIGQETDCKSLMDICKWLLVYVSVIFAWRWRARIACFVN